MEEDASVRKLKKVKSISFIQEHTSTDKSKANKSFDFASLHNKARKERAPGETPKRFHKKPKEGLLNGSDNNVAAATSTPKPSTEKHKSLKSIMKSTSLAEESVESFTPDYYANKRKKRNKSVSFVLEDESESKKSKPDDTSEKNKSKKHAPKSPVEDKIRKKERKHKKLESSESEQAEKENVNESNNFGSIKASRGMTKDDEPTPDSTVDDANNNTEIRKKQKDKKNKKAKRDRENPEKYSNRETADAVKSTTETKESVKKSKNNKSKPDKENPETDSKRDTADEVKSTTQSMESVKKSKNKKAKQNKENPEMDSNRETADPVKSITESTELVKKSKNKKAKQDKENSETDSNRETADTVKSTTESTVLLKKSKNKKREVNRSNSVDNGEPQSKTRKQESEATIAEVLENLKLGDNPHTLTNLLDDMTVAGKKNKTINNSGKEKKGKGGKETKNTKTSVSTPDVVESLVLENIEEGKEKIKWTSRKWNKDNKTNDNYLFTSVLVENLPLKIMLNYKKLLSEHFARCGVIKGIGIAEVYPTEEPKPVFTTTINFAEESAATKALEEDNTSYEGSRIRVKRPLPPTATTVVVRSYGELTEQALSSAFTGAGRIRNIRHPLKGKKTISSAFVEFDGPQSVERALKMAEVAKIGGKKIHVSQFEARRSKNTRESKDKNIKKKDSSDSDD